MIRIFILFIVCLFSFCVLTACSTDRKTEHILFDFESEAVLDKLHWKCHTLYSLSDLYETHGGKSLKIDFYPSPYPGLSPKLAYHDWQGFKTFCFDVYNPGQTPLKLTLRIDDKKDANDYQDRYNQSFQISPGPNTIQVPLENLMTSGGKRPLNVKQIYRFLVFMVHPEEKQTLYLDYFRLIPHQP